MKITFKGNQHTNKNIRVHPPTAICNHISAGTMSSMRSWFTSPNNNVSSSVFGISKSGEIDQYIDWEKYIAWTQGIPLTRIQFATAQIVHDRGINPNHYMIGIEHEGMDGRLTDAQFESSVWLHFYIQKEVKRIWGHEIPLDPYHVVGHFQVDPIRKSFCPGPYFPWEQLYERLKGDDEVKEIEALKKRITALEAKQSMPVPEWAKEAVAEAVKLEIVDTPDGGSYDFYRMITVLYRKGLLGDTHYFN